MSAATSSRWSATSSRSPSTWCARSSSTRCAPRRSRTPRSGCSICCCRRARSRPTRIRPACATRRSARASDCASSCARAASTIGWSRSKCARRAFPSLEIIAGRRVEEIEFNIKDMMPGLFQGRSKKKRVPVRDAMDALTQEEEQKLIDMDQVARIAVDRVQQAGIIFLDEIDKIAGREGGHGTGRQPRRRAARHPADRRGHDGQHQARHGAHRSHPVHRGRRVSRLEAVGSDSRSCRAAFRSASSSSRSGRRSSCASSPSRGARWSSSTSR